MYALGCDYSYAVPTAEQVKAVGYTFVMRYLSWQPGKNITPLELLALHSQGIAVGFVWESTGVDPMQGASAGANDGAEAGRQARALNIPHTVPLFWAFDTDDRAWAPGYWQGQLRAYGDAFARASGYFAFPYGSGRVIDFFGGGWQTIAWSGAYVSPHAWLYQRSGGCRLSGSDEDVLYNGYALWFPPSKNDPVAVDKYLHALADQAEVDKYLHALADAAKGPVMTETGYPDITGNDHTHPKALAELKRKLTAVNPKADVHDDAATLATIEGMRAFFKITGGKGKPRVDDPVWRALNYLSTVEHG